MLREVDRSEVNDTNGEERQRPRYAKWWCMQRLKESGKALFVSMVIEVGEERKLIHHTIMRPKQILGSRDF